MRLRRNEFCPIHKSVSCCGREILPKPRLIRLGVQRVEDPHHPRGYRELRSPGEMRKLLNRKIVEQNGISCVCDTCLCSDAGKRGATDRHPFSRYCRVIAVSLECVCSVGGWRNRSSVQWVTR